MEKDYFLDRPVSVQEHLQVASGRMAFICTKDAQKYAKVLDDLKLIKINNTHTGTEVHPRGQKVTGILVQRDRFGNDIIGELQEEKGRCTYFVEKDGVSVDTKEGMKRITIGKDGLELIVKEKLIGMLQLGISFRVVDADFSPTPFIVRMPFSPYQYFREKQEIPKFISYIGNVSNAVLRKGTVEYDLKENRVIQSKIFFLFNKKNVSQEMAWNSLCNVFSPMKSDKLSLNNEYYLEHCGYYAVSTV